MSEKPRIGKLGVRNGKYFLEAEGKIQELPVGPLAEEGDLKELVGQDVEIVLSEPRRFVVAIVAKKPRVPIICYIPVPDWIRRDVITEKLAAARLAKRFLDEGYITKEIYEKIAPR